MSIPIFKLSIAFVMSGCGKINDATTPHPEVSNHQGQNGNFFGSEVDSDPVANSPLDSKERNRSNGSENIIKKSNMDTSNIMKVKDCEKIAWAEISKSGINTDNYQLVSTIDRDSVYCFYFESNRKIKIPGQNFMVSVDKFFGTAKLIRGD